MPRYIQSPHTHAKHPENKRHVSHESSQNEQRDLKETEDCDENPRSLPQHNHKRLHTDLPVVLVILRCVEHVEVDDPDHHRCEQGGSFRPAVQAAGYGDPAGEYKGAVNDADDDVWEWHDAFHQGVYHAEHPDGREGDDGYGAEGVICHCEDDGDPGDENGDGFPVADHAGWEGAVFGAFDVFVEVHVEDVAVVSFSLGISFLVQRGGFPGMRKKCLWIYLMVQMKQCATVQLAQIPNMDLQNVGKSREMSKVPAATQAPQTRRISVNECAPSKFDESRIDAAYLQAPRRANPPLYVDAPTPILHGGYPEVDLVG